MTDIIQSLYGVLDQLNVSSTGLWLVVGICALGFLFATREMLAWFTKTNDIKRDLHRLEEIMLQVESDVRLMQSLIKLKSTPLTIVPPTDAALTPRSVNSEAESISQPVSAAHLARELLTGPSGLSDVEASGSSSKIESKALFDQKAKRPEFPINH